MSSMVGKTLVELGRTQRRELYVMQNIFSEKGFTLANDCLILFSIFGWIKLKIGSYLANDCLIVFAEFWVYGYWILEKEAYPGSR